MNNATKITELGKVPAEWNTGKLGDFLSYTQPGKFIAQEISPEKSRDSVPVLTANKSFVVGYTSESSNIFDEIPVIIFDDFTTDSKYVDFPFKVRSSALKILTTSTNQVDLKFLYEAIKLIVFPAAEHKRYWISEYQNKIVPIPPIREQKKIAEILSTVDEKIDVIEDQINQTQELKRGLMQRLLTKGIGHTQFKTSPLGEIPESWSYGKISDYCDVENYLRKPLSAEVRKLMKGDYPYYGPTGIIDRINEYMIDGEYALIGEDGDHFLKYDFWSMTHLVSGKFNVNNHAHLLKGKPGCLTSWIHTFFQHRNIVPFLTRQGAGRYKLTKETLLQLPMLLPPLDEQRKIVNLLSTVDVKKKVSQEKRVGYQELKKGLMQQLLTGRIRVNQTNKADEPTQSRCLQQVVEG